MYAWSEPYLAATTFKRAQVGSLKAIAHIFHMTTTPMLSQKGEIDQKELRHS